MKLIIDYLVPIIFWIAVTMEAPKVLKFVVQTTLPRIHQGLGNMEKFNDALIRKK